VSGGDWRCTGAGPAVDGGTVRYGRCALSPSRGKPHALTPTLHSRRPFLSLPTCDLTQPRPLVTEILHYTEASTQLQLRFSLFAEPRRLGCQNGVAPLLPQITRDDKQVVSSRFTNSACIETQSKGTRNPETQPLRSLQSTTILYHPLKAAPPTHAVKGAHSHCGRCRRTDLRSHMHGILLHMRVDPASLR